MASPLKVILVDSDAASRAELRRMLRQAHGAVVAEYESIAEALLSAASHRADVAVVEVADNDATDQLASINGFERLVRGLRDTAIVATGPTHSAHFVIDVIHAGALEYLKRPVEAEALSTALSKVGRARRPSAPDAVRAQVTAVFSPSGGVGVTTLAINLATAISETAATRVLLLELDTRPSDTTTFLDITPPYSVLDALANIDRIDESFIQGIVVKYGNGLSVLTGPRQAEAGGLAPDRVHAMLDITRAHFDHIIIDCRHDYDAGTTAALEASDAILLVTTPNVASLRAASSAVKFFRGIGIEAAKIKPVIMRERTGLDVKAGHIKDALPLPVFWNIPNDYAAAIAAINHGRPLAAAAPRSKLTLNIRELAAKLSTAPRRARPTSRFRLPWSKAGRR